METLILFHNSKWYSPIWALLFSMSLVLLWFRRDCWRKGYETFFSFVIISVGIIYCPLFTKILVPRFLPSFAEYERLAWIFYEIPLLSYVLIMLTKSIVTPKKQLLFVIAFALVFLLLGSPDNRDFFQKPQNCYKISQDALTISHKLNSFVPQGNVVLCIQLDSINAYSYGAGQDGSLYFGIRTYESRFRIRNVVIPPEEYSQEDFSFTKDLPADIVFYICPKSNIIYRELTRLGYTYLDESPNYTIFYNNYNSEGVHLE